MSLGGIFLIGDWCDKAQLACRGRCYSQASGPRLYKEVDCEPGSKPAFLCGFCFSLPPWAPAMASFSDGLLTLSHPSFFWGYYFSQQELELAPET